MRRTVLLAAQDGRSATDADLLAALDSLLSAREHLTRSLLGTADAHPAPAESAPQPRFKENPTGPSQLIGESGPPTQDFLETGLRTTRMRSRTKSSSHFPPSQELLGAHDGEAALLVEPVRPRVLLVDAEPDAGETPRTGRVDGRRHEGARRRRAPW